MKQIKQLLQVGAQFTIYASPFEVAHVGKAYLRAHPCKGGVSKRFEFATLIELVRLNSLEITFSPSKHEGLSRTALTNAQCQSLDRKIKYVNAVLNGTDKVGSQKEIAPIIEKTSQKIKDGKPPATSTVAAWIKTWIANEYSERALMPKNKPSRAFQPENTKRNEIIMSAIKKVYMNKQRNSISAVAAEVSVAIAEFNTTAETRLDMPSQETIRKMAKRIDRYQLDKARHGAAYANRKHRAAGMSMFCSEPLELTMADGQVMDVIVVEEIDDDRPPKDIGRPFITIIQDVFSRCILGAHVSLAPFCGATVLKTLSIASVASGGEPRGIPSKLIIDNGCDYQDSGFLASCNKLGIEVEPCPPKSPRSKAHVERFFRTLNENLIHKLQGTTFSNPTQRGDYQSQHLARLTLGEVRKHVDTYIQEVYHQRPHRTLVRAPINVWSEGLSSKPVRTIDLDEADILIRTVEQRVVQNGCVHVHGLDWQSDALRTWELSQRGLRRKPQVEVRLDELDLSYVYVVTPDNTGAPFKAVSRKPHYTKGLSLYEHRLLRKALQLKANFEQFHRYEDLELLKLRHEYYASLGHADDKVAAVRRDRLRDLVSSRARAGTQEELLSGLKEPTTVNSEDIDSKPASKEQNTQCTEPHLEPELRSFKRRTVRRIPR